jgi:hypothetical protein
MDMQYGYAGWKCSMEIKHGHKAWTEAWTCSKDMKHGHENGHAARTCRIDMDMQVRHAA